MAAHTVLRKSGVVTYARPNIKWYPENGCDYYKEWKMSSTNSHILGSQCNCSATLSDVNAKCQFCIFENKLKLPHLPEMVFADNCLCIHHLSGVSIEFNALDALLEVSADKADLEVACAQAWRDVRKGCALLEEEVKNPYDWTYTTQYCGTLKGDIRVEPTEERINLQKLKEKEKILFYQDVMLFEDELHDNGIALCNVKIRMMPNSFFILLRFFLRVDGVFVRVNDTRIYHEFGLGYLLREITSWQANISDNKIDPMLCKEPDTLIKTLPVASFKYEKLFLPLAATSVGKTVEKPA